MKRSATAVQEAPFLVQSVALVPPTVPRRLRVRRSPGRSAFVWGTTSTTVRQRAVPTELQGRVSSVYLIGVQGGIVAGSLAGGVIAGIWGVTAPFWFAFVGSGVLVVLIWPQLTHIAHTDETHLRGATPSGGDDRP